MFLRRFSHTIAPISPDLFLFINNNFFKRRPIQKMEMRKNWNLKKNLYIYCTQVNQIIDLFFGFSGSLTFRGVLLGGGGLLSGYYCI